MKLAAKLVLVLVILISALLAADGFLLVRRAESDFDAGIEHDAGLFGQMLSRFVGETWRTGGRERALELIAGANIGPDTPRVRWTEGRPADQGSTARDPDYRYTYVPVRADGEIVGELEIAEPIAPLRRFEGQTVLRVLTLTGVMVLASALVIIWFGLRWIGRPLDLLIEKVRKVGIGDLSGPVALRGSSELGELADAVNVMCEDLAAAQESMRAETEARIEAVEQLRHADRLRTVGRLASGMAHELGAPLNVISARAGMIAGGLIEGGDAKESAVIIRTQSERMTTLIRQLLDFARPSTPKRVNADLRSLLRETVEFVAPLGYPGNVRVVPEGGGEAVRARIDPAQIHQVLANLVSNALQAMPDGGEVRLELGTATASPPEAPDAPPRDLVTITVTDEGVGMGEEDLPHVFEPFFTTKGVGEGTGLGLSIAHGIVHEHGGWIEVSSTPGSGSEFRVYLPAGDET